METITLTLVLLACVIASSIVKRAARIPLPLAIVQIAIGALIAQIFRFRVSLAPDVFLLLFVSPLLFLDGWRISKEGLFRDKWTIGAFALGLVLFTVLGAGFFIHWLIPLMPLPVAFALAATLSPTDAVAVSAIAERVPIPPRLMNVLAGEALLNDASGLVCLRFAITAAVTGSFSVAEASGTFLWLVAGGVAAGAGVTLLANAAKDWTARLFGEETGTQILISLLLPFGAYVVADRLAASGILAAVTAGVVMSYEELAGKALASTRIRRAAVWDALQFAGNGVIFVLLGQQLFSVIDRGGQVISQTGRQQEVWLLLYVAAISGALLLIRFLWTWAALRVIVFRTGPGTQTINTSGWRLITATSLAGVRGAVSLSGVMTLPLLIENGSPFPARDLAILLAAGVIVVTLIAANVGLPYVLSGIKVPPGTLERRQEDDARGAAARAAIVAVERALHETRQASEDADLFSQAGARLIAHYREQIALRGDGGQDARRGLQIDEIERRLRLLALGAERDELYRVAQSGKLTDELVRDLVREVDLQESRFSGRGSRS
ncbi:Na+/H+ antiporter [Paraburkholderia bryophila]|uniref:CPA1 family monovalent cation:H+ antiporter n=1 Tax=Paraburkholderia bryophila TaxID=420952 RepID=A0A7Y9W935_9BURK|nr:CPA1 family monovalent cation:H+ antiporter [Paraburkholderia bryophila]